jgi:hypothetical protein
LIGEDARFLDETARSHPDELYDAEFLAGLSKKIPRRDRADDA